MRARYGEFGTQDKGSVAKDLRRVLLGTGAILLVPLVAMRFTAEVNWAELAVGIFGSPIDGS